MKVFILFIALLILNMSFVSYIGDLNRYVQLQAFLKAVAEEAATGSALYYDEGAYSNGDMIINRAEGEKYIEYLLGQTKQKLKMSAGESLFAEMDILDDSNGAADMGVSPSVTVTLHLTVTDLFRLPFLSRKQVVRSAKYELADYR